MASALCLDEDNRIHSAWKVLPNGNYEGMPIVESLPDGDITEYLYVNGEFVHDPPHVEEVEPEQSTEELLLETAADHEYRICLMELGIDESEVI